MDAHGVLGTELDAHLADGLEEGQRLDVTDGAADLDDGHVGLAGRVAHSGANLVGDVRDHLDGRAEVLAASLLRDHRVVDPPGGEVVRPAHGGRGEALVVAEVEIGLGAVVGDEDLAVLVRRHRPRIDVDVGVELEVGDAKAARLHERADRGGSEPLADGADDASGHEDELGAAGHGAVNLREREWGRRRGGSEPRPARASRARPLRRGEPYGALMVVSTRRVRARRSGVSDRHALMGSPRDH